jgi:N-acyl-D-amino-acid deacylase
MFDIIIKNGTVIDGTGKPMYRADVGVKEGKITEIGGLHNERADVEIEAGGKYVVPGFIDVTNHSDTYWRIFLNPDLESLIYQGITTIIGGNCGSSLAPLARQDIIKTIQKWADIRSINLNWLNMEEFLAEVEKKNLSVNFATLVGHSTLRRGLIGDQVRNLTAREIKTMKEMLKNAMKQGALGLSTGLVYTHAKRASEEELAELAEVVRKYNGVYATHIRGEAEDLLDSVEEAVRIARASGVKLQISHLKAMGEKNWPLQSEAIAKVENARGDGMDVNFDVFPYTVTGSVLYILLPDWVSEGGREMMVRRLREPHIKAKVVEEMRQNNFDYSKVIISISALDKTLTRKRISDLALSQGKLAEEVVVDLLVASESRVVTAMEVLSEKNVSKAIQHPFSIISSNGAGYNVEHRSSGELVHSRNFGSFPRVLSKYVVEKKFLSWEEAIRKMSGRPAEKYAIKKRGAILKDNFADLVVIDPDNIQDLATIENPYQYSKGIDTVIVNGQIALDNGAYTGQRGGMVIRRESSSFFG